VSMADKPSSMENPLFGRTTLDRRKSPRFQLRARVIFQKNGQPPEEEEWGFTRDISVGGVFVLCERPVPAGTDVALEVHPPSPNPKEREGMRLAAPGRVIRVSGPGEESGFAAVSSFAYTGEPH